MLDQDTKRRINSARQVLVGVVPDPKSQVEQITTALIYKFMDDMDRENEDVGRKPIFLVGELADFAWGRLMSKEISGVRRWELYTRALDSFARSGQIPELFCAIFKAAILPYRNPETLNLFLKEIDGFTYDHSERMGDAFEYLLSILGSQGDAGQFRTPRHIIDFIAEVVAPKKSESILDPACGTAGFLISAYQYIKKTNSKNYDAKTDIPAFARTDDKDIGDLQIQNNGKYQGDKLSPDDKKRLMKNICGYDISPEMVRLSRVNMYLHRFIKPDIAEYDALTFDDKWNDDFDVILANPPFMSPKGGIRPHGKFMVSANRAEVLFVDYIAEHLTNKGRAGIIVPEGIIFQSANAYKELRKRLMKDWGLFAVVSLPPGVFNPYSGVKTSILFLDKRRAKQTDKILFAKIVNDGFDLGAQRRKISVNDLPAVFAALREWQGKQTTSSAAAIAVGKDKIAALEESEAHSLAKKHITGLAQRITKSGRDSARIIAIENLNEVFGRRVISPKTMPADIGEFAAKKYERFLSKTAAKYAQTADNEIPLSAAIKGLIDDAREYNLSGERYRETTDYNNTKYGMVKIGELCELGRGRVISKKDIENAPGGAFPVYSSQTVNDGVFGYLYSYDFDGEYATWTTDGANAGTVFYRNGKFNCTNVCGTLQKKKSAAVDMKYIAKALNSVAHKHVIQVGNPKLMNNVVAKIKIPLPPLAVQQEIVAELDGYEKIITGAKQIIENWKSQIAINPNWDVVRLGDICEMVKDKPQEYKGVKKYFATRDVKKSKKPTFEMVEYQKRPSRADIYPKIHDVGFAKMKDTNKSIYVDAYMSDSIFSTGFAFLRSKGSVLPKYLCFCVASQQFQYTKNALAVDGIMGGIRQNDIMGIKIPLPPLAVQRRIVAQIEAERAVVESNKKLVEIYAEKTKQTIAKLWR